MVAISGAFGSACFPPLPPRRGEEARLGEGEGLLSYRVDCCRGEVVCGRWGVLGLGDVSPEPEDEKPGGPAGRVADGTRE